MILYFTAMNYYYFRTNGDYQYEEFLATTESSYIVFEVKAAKKAEVALLYDPKNTHGGFTYSYHVVYDSPLILNDIW